MTSLFALQAIIKLSPSAFQSWLAAFCCVTQSKSSSGSQLLLLSMNSIGILNTILFSYINSNAVYYFLWKGRAHIFAVRQSVDDWKAVVQLGFSSVNFRLPKTIDSRWHSATCTSSVTIEVP